MSEPRFIVTELTGYKIRGSNPGTPDARASTDYFVQDCLSLYAVVASFRPVPNGTPNREQRKQAAEAECAALNAWWQEELARGVVA